ncbi:MAG: hypothetical protein IJV35_06835 [Neisseriaceae bacterium]|nr:hypothetical protein [Neisseriaceae bacterium]
MAECNTPKTPAAFVLPIGKTGLPRFFLRKNLAMTRVFVSGCLKGLMQCH